MSKPIQNPSQVRPPWGEGWGVGLRVWIERAGRAVLGTGRLELLEGIARLGTISAAARQMGMSYRRAWELVQSINEGAGEPLVLAATGGAHGGGAQLTPLGRWAVAAFRDVQAQLHHSAANLVPRLSNDVPSPTLHVAAAVSLEEVVGQLLTEFGQQAPGLLVRAVYGASDELADHLLAGAPGDLFLTADPRQIQRLGEAQLVNAEQQVPLAENGLAAIGLAGKQLAIHLPADLARPNHRIALAQPGCPLGNYTRTYLDNLKLYESLGRRAVWVENSRAAVTAVRAGQADAALVYSSDANRAAGCRPLFHVRRLQAPICYRGVVIRRSQQALPAAQLLTFLASSRSARRFRQCGFLAIHKAR